MTTHAASRPTRTDAQRNRAHIIAVAEEGFADLGVEVSMDAIAKRAVAAQEPGPLAARLAQLDRHVRAVALEAVEPEPRRLAQHDLDLAARVVRAERDARRDVLRSLREERELGHGDYLFIGHKLLRVEINAA